MSKKKPNSTPTWFLRVRQYPDKTFSTVWVCRQQHGAVSALLWGEVLPCMVDELAAALGLKVEREDYPLQFESHAPPGCVPVAKQGELFGARDES